MPGILFKGTRVIPAERNTASLTRQKGSYVKSFGRRVPRLSASPEIVYSQFLAILNEPSLSPSKVLAQTLRNVKRGVA